MGPQGIVGQVLNVSDNYATVWTLLHRQFKVVVKLKNGGERGTLEWDGVSPKYVTLKDIPKSAKVKKGDSVVTSPTSIYVFRCNLMVGTIDEIVDDKSSNFYTLKVKPATNFFNIEYVYVIDNAQIGRTKSSGRFHAKKIPMSELLKNIFRFVLFIFVQVFILFKMPPLHRFITPYLYYLYILWLPFSMTRSALDGGGLYIRSLPGLFHAYTGITCRRLCADCLSETFCREYADIAGRSR